MNHIEMVKICSGGSRIGMVSGYILSYGSVVTEAERHHLNCEDNIIVMMIVKNIYEASCGAEAQVCG